MDGHDLDHLLPILRNLRDTDHQGPILLHVVTQKGKGYEPAMAKQKKFHGLGPYDAETGETKALGQPTYSEVFADHLSKMADHDPRIVAITGAMPNGTGLDRFQPKHPDRYFDVGIAEEHAVLFAAGMATKGFKPFCAIYSTFLQRAYDQIIHDVCLQNLPVVFCMDRGGLSGDDGPTHHGLFDISYMRGVPNIVHMSPKDEDEFVDMLYTASLHNGPSAIRYPRGTGPNATIKKTPLALPIGKAEVIRHGKKVAIWSYGQMLPMALQLSDELKGEGIEAAVINARFAKPMDSAMLELFAKSADVIVTFEDHVLKGGFGSGVLEELAELGIQTPVVRIGWPDEFVDHGKPEALRERYGVSVAAAKEKLAPYLAQIKGTGRKLQPTAA